MPARTGKIIKFDDDILNRAKDKIPIQLNSNTLIRLSSFSQDEELSIDDAICFLLDCVENPTIRKAIDAEYPEMHDDGDPDSKGIE